MAIDDAAHGARSELTCVPHGAKAVLHNATVLGPGRANRRWDPAEKAKITAEIWAPPLTA